MSRRKSEIIPKRELEEMRNRMIRETERFLTLYLRGSISMGRPDLRRPPGTTAPPAPRTRDQRTLTAETTV